MDVFISGLNNYVARNFVTYLAQQEHSISCLVGTKHQSSVTAYKHLGVQLIRGDLFSSLPGSIVPPTTDVAFYFNQSPSKGRNLTLELLVFQHFLDALKEHACRHILFVTKLTDEAYPLFEKCLRKNQMTFTIVRVSNIVGKDALLVDIIEKLSNQSLIFVSRQFVERKCRPIALIDVCQYLDCLMLDERSFGQVIDLGGPDLFSYKEIYEHYQLLTNRSNRVVMLPSWAQRLSVWMVDSLFPNDPEVGVAFQANLKNELVKAHPSLSEWYPLEPLSVEESLRLSLAPYEDQLQPDVHEWN